MYYDLLAKIKNAELAKKDTVVTRFTKFDFAVANVLKDAGYLRDAQKTVLGRNEHIEMKLPKSKDGSKIIDFKIVSRPSRHLYVKTGELRVVKRGFGLSVISTPKGVMSGKDARKNKVGGEYLFEVW